jgi:hypothetical protein
VVTDRNTRAPQNGDIHLYINGTDPPQATMDESWTIDSGTNGKLYIGGREQGPWSPSFYIDEFAVFPGLVDQYFIQSEFVHTKFYLSLVSAPPANPPEVVVDEDGCTDPDNTAALNLILKMDKLGYVKLEAVIDSDVQVNSDKFFREILDSNGLANIPLAYSGGSTYSSNPTDPNFCSYYATQFSSYNSSVPTSYPEATPVLRQVIASLPAGHKLAILSGGSSASIAELMQSAADGISSETGAQMFANHISEVFFQGVGNLVSEDSSPSAYIMAHNGAVPMYLFDDATPLTCCTPTDTGPGYGHTRSPTDPLLLVTNAGWTGELRTGWDSLPAVDYLTGAFRGTCATGTLAITAGTSGGTGGTFTWSTSTNSQQYACPMTSLADPAREAGQVFTWFVNSIANTVSHGYTRSVPRS